MPGGSRPSWTCKGAWLRRAICILSAPKPKKHLFRLRSIPSREKTEAAESEYARLRSQADESDRNPELYLLSSYLELHEYDKLESFLKQLGEKYPNDAQILALTALYTKAANEAQGK